MSEEKYLLIDGSSMLVTNYYGNLPKEILFEKDEQKKKALYSKILQTSNGVYTNAIFGMLKQLFKIIKEQKPTHIAIAFDQTRDTFRRKLYADYKGNRGETPDPLKQQFINIEKILEEMGFKVYYDLNYEADDIVGSISKKIIEEKKKIVDGVEVAPTIYVATKDHDYLQLVSDNVRLWLFQITQEKADELCNKYYNSEELGVELKDFNLPQKAFEVTPPICKEEYGVWPNQIPDLKGIQGDSSDNIPGIKGVSSAAIPLLDEYGTLENIIEVIESANDNAKEEKEINTFWKESLGISRSPMKSIKAGKDMGLLSKDLATIRYDYEIPYSVDELRFIPNNDIINAKLKEYQMNSLIDSFK